ncbi:MAG: transporter [Elusimicrobiota bacterium]
MKKTAKLIVMMLFFAGAAEARINMFEPWHPGQDSKIRSEFSFQYIGSVLFGDKLQEIPFQLSYTAGKNIEVGGRWGVKNFDGHFGISDLLLGMKYGFLEETINKPSVIGEIGFSLPTADQNNGLGTGSVGLLLNWAIEKRIETLTGYFGLGMAMYSENSDKVQYGNIFSYHVGAGSQYNKLLRIHMEFKGFNHGAAKTAGIQTLDNYQEMYLAPGANYNWTKQNMILSGSLLFGLTPESHKLGFIISSNF